MRAGLAAVLLASALAAAGGGHAAVLETERYRIRVATVATGLERPWSLAWLPDGRMLVTERPGRLRAVAPDGRVGPPLANVPKVAAGGQGGLLDVAVDPAFRQNRRIYLSYSEPGRPGAGTAAASAALGDGALEDVRVIFRQGPKTDGRRHFGSRIVVNPDGTLFVTTGDRNKPDQAQDVRGHLGKIMRIHADGRVPADNPFAGRADARPEIWSWGHRNPQGAALHPDTGALWSHEHGARGGDEINIVAAGRNYGWPVIAYGRHYWGGKIGIGQSAPGMEQPVHYWDPSIAPSGMAFYTGDVFPDWRGNLLVGALKARLLVRLTLDGDRVTGEERLLGELRERIRDVRQGPDGYVYVLTDAYNGRLLRLEPAGQ